AECARLQVQGRRSHPERHLQDAVPVRRRRRQDRDVRHRREPPDSGPGLSGLPAALRRRAPGAARQHGDGRLLVGDAPGRELHQQGREAEEQVGVSLRLAPTLLALTIAIGARPAVAADMSGAWLVGISTITQLTEHWTIEQTGTTLLIHDDASPSSVI